jgi:hypothetical protein
VCSGAAPKILGCHDGYSTCQLCDEQDQGGSQDSDGTFVSPPPPHKVLAISGGSGQFATARGDGTLDENGEGTGTLVLKLQP